MSVIINGSAGVTTNSGAVYDGISRGTSVTASGTSIDFTSIPSWVKRITVMLDSISTNGSSNYILQIGNGSIVTTGYSTNAAAISAGGTGVSSASNGFILTFANISTAVCTGAVVLTNLSGNTWLCNGQNFQTSYVYTNINSNSFALGGTLDRVRITTVNGTDTFDAGTINIIYE